MKIVAGNVAVIEGDQTHAKWIEELGTIHHDPWFRDEVCRNIKPNDLCVDVGANIGTITRAMLDVGARVWAFEPNPDAYECLEQNCPEAKKFPVGLTDVQGFYKLNSDASNAGATYLGERNREPFGIEGLHAPCIEFDRLHEISKHHIHLFKLDCEGFEPRAIRGASQTIARCRPVIICEVNKGALKRAGSSDGELLDLIKSHGYNLQVMQPQCKIGDEMYDVICTPE